VLCCAVLAGSRYTGTLLKRVASGSVCYSKSRKCFVSKKALFFKAEEYTDMTGNLAVHGYSINQYSRTSLILILLIQNLSNPNTTFNDIHIYFSVIYIEYKAFPIEMYTSLIRKFHLSKHLLVPYFSD